MYKNREKTNKNTQKNIKKTDLGCQSSLQGFVILLWALNTAGLINCPFPPPPPRLLVISFDLLLVPSLPQPLAVLAR